MHPPGDVAHARRHTRPGRGEEASDLARDGLPRPLTRHVGIGRMDDQPAAVVDQPRDHDGRDEPEDGIRLPVRVAEQPALRGRVAEEASGPGDEPAHEGDGDPEEHDQFHDVAEDQIRPAEQPHAEAENVEPVAVAAAEHRHDLEAQDREAPEDEEVHPARARLVHGHHLGPNELLLAEEVHGDGLEPLDDAIEAVDGSGGAQQVEAPPELADEDAERDEEA